VFCHPEGAARVAAALGVEEVVEEVAEEVVLEEMVVEVAVDVVDDEATEVVVAELSAMAWKALSLQLPPHLE